MSLGQYHYVIARPEGDGYRYWRRHGNQAGSGWVYDMSAARSYRTPGAAMSAARQIDAEPDEVLEVLELAVTVERVIYRVKTSRVLAEAGS